jgi:hypothetical protein
MTTRAPGRLGKLPAKQDPRTLELAHYIDRATFAGAALPTKVLDTPNVASWPMFENDQLGDCVEAAMGHVAELLSKMGQGTEVTITDNDVIKVYEDVAGYRPGDPSTDRGTVMLDALNYWRKTGIAGHKILGFAAFNPKSYTEWKAAIALFGVAFVGVALPLSAQAQTGPGKEWKVTTTTGGGAPGSWGGHGIPFFDYSRYEVDCITWGFRQRASWPWVGTYCDEAYVCWDAAWVNAVSKKAPSGLDVVHLQSALAQFS